MSDTVFYDSDVYYYIINKKNGKVLASEDRKVFCLPNKEEPENFSQQWKFCNCSISADKQAKPN